VFGLHWKAAAVSAQSDVDRSRRAIQDLQRKISQESGKVANARQKASRASQAAHGSRSSSTVSSKLREAQQEERRAIRAEADRSKLERKLADEQKKLHTAEAKLLTEQARTQQAAMKELRDSVDRSSQQFRPTFAQPSPSPKPSRSVPFDVAATPTYDVFISHASEDKPDIATPLAESLRSGGLRVWFDAFELQVGDSLRRKIDQGLARSTFGVVILSPHFFAKEWPQIELDGLTARATAVEDPVILPIWHHISKAEVLARSPTLAGVVALNTSIMTIDEIVDALVKRIKPSN
jgi:hypothetical protein